MISEVLVAEMKQVVICVFAVERAHSRRDIMPVNARNCVKDTTLTTQFFFVCFIFIGPITTSIFLDACKSNHH